MIKESQDNYSVEHLYDKQGNLTQLKSNLGADVKLDYNEYGWVTQMDSQTWQVKFSYDKQGLEIQRDLSGGIKVETERDNYGRVIRRGVAVNGVMKVSDRYKWNRTNQLQSIVSDLTRHRVDFKYNQWDNLVSGSYTTANELKTIYKTPDAVGNLYESAKQDDRVYDKGGKLLKDELHYYYYDAKGNLVFKEYKNTEHPSVVDKKEIQDRFKIKLQGSGIGYQYIWSVSGMLQEVISPMGNQVQFYYDPMGRRIAKTSKGETTRWVWDGNVPLHEWKHKEIYPLPMVVNKAGKLAKATESTENLITWLYEVNSFVPCGKIVDGESFSIVSDYLGTPEYMYNAKGELVWHGTLDIYGRITIKKGDKYDCPFRYQGQYADRETGGLYYNRFRYYDSNTGLYISQDPIGIEGGIALYGYVHDINNWIDYLGLTGTPSAKAKAKEAAKNLRTQYRKGLINDLPTATTAVVNKRTGEVFIGNSGIKPTVTNTTLLQEMPKVSLEKWPVNNCGEVDALDKALKRKGTKLSDLEVFTVRTSTGKKMKPCKNCEITTKHTH